MGKQWKPWKTTRNHYIHQHFPDESCRLVSGFPLHPQRNHISLGSPSQLTQVGYSQVSTSRRSRDLIQVLHAAESSKSLSFPYGPDGFFIQATRNDHRYDHLWPGVSFKDGNMQIIQVITGLPISSKASILGIFRYHHFRKTAFVADGPVLQGSVRDSYDALGA